MTGFPDRPLTRRRLLAGAAGAALAGISGGALAACGGSDDADPDAVARDLFGDEAAARWLGGLYLATRPAETTRHQLTARLFPDGRTGSGAADDLRELIREDYARGRTVQLEGWYVAETEARAAALVSVARREPR